MIDSILNFFSEQKSEFGNLTPNNLCIMQAPLIGTNSILNKDGSLTTTLAINGSYSMMGNDTFDQLSEYLQAKFSGMLKKPGLIISISYNKDNMLTRNKLKENLRSGWKKVNYGFKVSDMLSQQEEVMTKRVAHERAYLSITTTVNVLPKVTAKKAVKNTRKAFTAALKKYMGGDQANNTQIPRLYIKDILKLHDSDVNMIKDILSQYLDVEILSPEETVKEMRSFYFPEASSNFFKAKIFGSSAKLNISENKDFVSQGDTSLIISSDKTGSDNDVSNLLYPNIANQIIPSDSEIDDKFAREIGFRGSVRIGSRYYAPVIMVAPPETHTRFDTLFNSIGFNVPFRMTINCETGMEKFVGKLSRIQSYSTMLAITNSDNKRIKNASSELVERYKSGSDVPLNTYTIFLTWGKTPEEAERNRDHIVSSIQSWGAPDVVPEYGDPYVSAMEAIPGFSRKKTAPGFIQGLSEIIKMLPYTRPSSPWKEGTMMFYTKGNKMWPYSIGSSLQKTWIELISAGPGSGKSVLMAASNISLVLGTPNDTLPKIGILDVGPSSSYMVKFIREMLPEHLKDEAVSYKIKMTSEYAFNPFDTLLGCRYPVSNDKSFLKNFLTLVLRPMDASKETDYLIGISELVSELIDEAYKYLDPELSYETSRKYTENQIPELDEIIKKYNLQDKIKDRKTPLFTVVDYLMENEEYQMAKKVQSYAVPLITDLSSVLTQSRTINDTYNDNDRGKALLAICKNQLSYASKAYPILTRPSVFDLGTASIVSLDLSEIVQTNSDPKVSSIAYLLARFMVGKNYYRDGDTVKESVIPEKYKQYHSNWIEKERARLKRLCMDEFHATKSNDSVRDQVVMDMRTGRKYNVIVTLASQIDKDFTNDMIDLATTNIIMANGNEQQRRDQIQKYGLNQDTANSLKNDLGSASEKGSSMIIFGSSKRSDFSQMVYFLPPPIILWALTTTTEDVLLRDYTAKREGDYMNALIKLSKVFQNGGAKRIFEYYRSNVDIEVPKDSTIEREICKTLYETDVARASLEQDIEEVQQ